VVWGAEFHKIKKKKIETNWMNNSQSWPSIWRKDPMVFGSRKTNPPIKIKFIFLKKL
jgi:hypothetical protein